MKNIKMQFVNKWDICKCKANIRNLSINILWNSLFHKCRAHCYCYAFSAEHLDYWLLTIRYGKPIVIFSRMSITSKHVYLLYIPPSCFRFRLCFLYLTKITATVYISTSLNVRLFCSLHINLDQKCMHAGITVWSFSFVVLG